MLVLGNVISQTMFAVVLGLSLAAFGEQARLPELLLVNTLVSLFSGLMPVPGGIGIAAAGLTAGMVAIGVPAPEALSAAIIYRVATFYVPPLYGGPALAWLRRSGYV